jgi:hypothetical protein
MMEIVFAALSGVFGIVILWLFITRGIQSTFELCWDVIYGVMNRVFYGPRLLWTAQASAVVGGETRRRRA